MIMKGSSAEKKRHAVTRSIGNVLSSFTAMKKG
jgi:hypothetical protein